MDIFPEVQAFVEARQLFADIDHVVVGFSGGIDSLALLLVLRQLCPSVEAVHLQHGLREADAADAAWCQQTCATLQLLFHSAKLNVRQRRQPGESIESAGRRCRHEFWRNYCRPTWAVALGHHADDCLEDMLLRLSRGANASGLSGLWPRRQLAGILIIRPLLTLRRSQLAAYVQQQWGQGWREDASNLDPAFRRNCVRHQWLPLLRSTIGHDHGLLHSLGALRLDADYLEQQAAAVVSAAVTPAVLRALHPALLPRVLRLWLQGQLRTAWLPRGSGLRRLRAALAVEEPTQPRLIPLGNGVIVRLHADSLTLVPPRPRPLQSRLWHWQIQACLNLPECGCELRASPAAPTALATTGSDKHRELFAATSLPAELQVRRWLPGDRMRLFGGGSKKLQDILGDAGVARAQRDCVPVIVAAGTIIWVAGIRRAEFGRLSADREPAVLLEYAPLAEAPRFEPAASAPDPQDEQD